MSKLEQARLDRERADIQAVLQTRETRRFIWRLLSYCGVYQDINHPTDTETYRAIGRRSVGLYMLGILSDIDEESVFTMMKEAKADAETDMLEQEELDKQNQSGEIIMDNRSSIDNFM